MASVALGGRVPGKARADGAVAAQAGQRGPARAHRAGRVRAARDAPAARVSARRAAGRAPVGAGVPAARRRAGRCRRAPGVRGRSRAGVERVGGQRAPDRPRRGGDLQRLASGARHAERVLAVPGVVPGLRRGRGDVPRAARVPALRLQRVGRVGDHPRGRRLAGPLPGAVLRRPVPDGGRVGAGRPAAGADHGARRFDGDGAGVGDQARADRARVAHLGDRAGAQVDRDLPGEQRIRVHVPDADGGLGRAAVRRAGRLGRSGQQPGLRRRCRGHRLSVPRRGAGAVIGGRAAAAGGRLGRPVRVDVGGAVR